MSVEEFLKSYENTISALSVLGTWAAVIVALWIAHRSSKPRLKVFVDKKIQVPSLAQTSGTVNWDLCEDVIGVTMQNRGSTTIYITYWSFWWKLPWKWFMAAQQNPYEPIFKSEPIKLEPGQSASISLSNDIASHRSLLEGICKKNKLPKFMRLFVRLYVYGSDGSQFKATMGESYKKAFC